MSHKKKHSPRIIISYIVIALKTTIKKGAYRWLASERHLNSMALRYMLTNIVMNQEFEMLMNTKLDKFNQCVLETIAFCHEWKGWKIE